MSNEINASILKYLKTNGPCLDFAIAEALKMPLARVRTHVKTLSASGDVISCNTIQFKDGAGIEGLSCRLSCHAPTAARGRKPGAKRNEGNDAIPE